MKALVTGATGFIGERLVAHLDDAVVLSRDSAAAAERLGARAFHWEPTVALPPPEAFDGVDTVFHLAGEPVAEGRWTRQKKERILESRVVGTRNLVDRILAMENSPKTLVSASAVGFYGSRGDEELTETSTPASGFLADVCGAWEAEARRAEAVGVRVVHVRIGIVLGADGGALASMLPIFRLGAGGRLGSGRQWMSWIHVEDLVRLMSHAAKEPAIHGPVNGVSPEPVTNGEFTRLLARQLHRPAILPAPAFALRLALGEFASVLLASQRVVPRVALDSGFRFSYPTLAEALENILKESPGAAVSRRAGAA